MAEDRIWLHAMSLMVALNVGAFITLVDQTRRNLWQIGYETNIDNAPRP